MDRGIGPTGVLQKPIFSETQRTSVLDQLATFDFQADWGTRGRASSSTSYNPNSYASGSVWATGTSGAAHAFWTDHRPATALPIWSALVSWSSLDSLGHMHEALAGDYYHEQVESVPEQTWSSAMFFTSAVHGLLGLQIDGLKNRIVFAPHLPPLWNAITVRNIHVGTSEITIHMIQSTDQVQVDLQNDGAPLEIVFDPEIALGAKLVSARIGTRSIAASREPHAQDNHAKVEFTLSRGNISVVINYAGGVALVSDPPKLLAGEPSKAIKITAVNLRDRIYSVDFDYLPSEATGFELRTNWAIQDVQGATFEAASPLLYRFTVKAPANDKEPNVYRHGKVVVTFAR